MSEDRQPVGSEYYCPGERRPVSRAIHLGRLASFYPACRQCPQRHDTGTLSAKQVQQLQETHARPAQPCVLFHDEGAGGLYQNAFCPSHAREIASAFGVLLSATAEVCSGAAAPVVTARLGDESGPLAGGDRPTIVLAGDGRPLSAEFVAAVCEGLRWAGCNVVDIGPATNGCTAFAVAQMQAAGGVAIAGRENNAHAIDMRFWAADARPLSVGGTLEPLLAQYQRGVRRPTRSAGGLRRHQAERAYLEVLARHYHGLRPLRVVAASASAPLVRYCEQLTAATACRIFYSPHDGADPAGAVQRHAAHFGIRVDGAGEACQAFDETGQAVSPEALVNLLTRRLVTTGSGKPGTVVVDEGFSSDAVTRLGQLGVAVVRCSARCADMSTAMRTHAALLGGDSTGRFWHMVATDADCGGSIPLPDALLTLTRLLEVLSRDDRQFSALVGRPEIG